MVPQAGYAPSEYLTKQWPEEAQIEGWFPLFAREQACFDVDEEASATASSIRERQSPLLACGSDASSGRVGRPSFGHLSRPTSGHLKTPRRTCRLGADAYVQECSGRGD